MAHPPADADVFSSDTSRLSNPSSRTSFIPTCSIYITDQRAHTPALTSTESAIGGELSTL
jgi:hypothetical protein